MISVPKCLNRTVVCVLLLFFQNVTARINLPVEDDVIVRRKECSININEDLPKFQPLYICPGTERFFQPQGPDGMMYMDAGHEIELYCESMFKIGFETKSIIAQCVSDHTFSVDGKMFEFAELACENIRPFHVALPTGIPCYGGASVVKVGFQIDTRFLLLMDVCYDRGLERTHYVHYEMTPAQSTHQSGVKRIGFYGGSFFNARNMNSVYSQFKQHEKIAEILGSTELADKVILPKTNLFLARGHLAAKADFIFGLHQRATFLFINAAPQWQTFNSQNWEKVESSLRFLIGARKLTVDVITGTFDTLSLKDVNGQPQKIFLSTDVNNNPTVPVPKFYYKIVLDQASHAGLAIIGVNNPYATMEEIKTDYILCEDISDQVTWIIWNKNNLKDGFSYACDVNQFVEAIGHLPPLSVRNLLL